MIIHLIAGLINKTLAEIPSYKNESILSRLEVSEKMLMLKVMLILNYATKS